MFAIWKEFERYKCLIHNNGVYILGLLFIVYALYYVSKRFTIITATHIEYPIVQPDYNVGGATSGHISEVAPHLTSG